ncbi:pseudouridine-5'-phosphate glycosidase [Endozoicomonas sp. GU-1]|uniref:pseudouridine-5'-phosphate glycosidase n=1 Tax=Endozoicomonas sp. GU-1 TaxID=3009078 RepID=UPI0022B538F5|nr:pseudouridine-5'-phosphate glycosidase [Endozoicomonas sp. GU-1]WBA81860.1 pseudouridine-5'-phosphate glycosidase [Endozoicomonas sp. GU-1]WBA84814.1 pseudouridine-5'-phosphate glycosidase [Endozoicomonas sp. GU-1]
MILDLGVTEKAIIPWLPKKLHEATEGRSLATNIELLKSNVQLASQIACDYCLLEKE